MIYSLLRVVVLLVWNWERCMIDFNLFIPILSTHFSHTCATQQPILSCHLTMLGGASCLHIYPRVMHF
jgi:hypothetical protein